MRILKRVPSNIRTEITRHLRDGIRNRFGATRFYRASMDVWVHAELLVVRLEILRKGGMDIAWRGPWTVLKG
jgi:hypothetical protein